MSDLAPLETLYDEQRGRELPLPPVLASLYGQLQFPVHSDRPHVIANFVTSLDGVVALNDSDQSGGGEISGGNEHDAMVMGLLRAVADAIIVGAGTLCSARQHLWTASAIYAPLAEAYQQLRAALGKSKPPLNVIVTARGALDLALPIFQSGEVPVLIVTTEAGAQRIRAQVLPHSVEVAAVQPAGVLSARAILEAVRAVRPGDLTLVEGGPQLMGPFFAEHALDELFLTLAPQIAGRDASVERPGLVAGKLLAPEDPIWGTLVGVKRSGNHLFLRYAFEASRRATDG
jgi:riboflavin biosynthesis pyrimidine reductase